MAIYLRFEGVNLSAFIDDTADLSTVRGGSFTLLQAPLDVKDGLKGPDIHITPIMESASVGFFEVIGMSCADAQKRVWDSLNKEEIRHYATFVVDAVEANDFAAARDALMARNRWRQMQAPSVVYPELDEQSPRLVCQLDHVRPGSEYDADAPEGKRIQSKASHLRRELGRKSKNGFYDEWAKTTFNWDYAKDLEEIGGNSERWGKLQNKIAVFYADGNKFGSKQKGFTTVDEQWAFSDGLRDLQSSFLRNLLMNKIKDDISWVNELEKVRLEVLLWGGDEMMFVVPAWKGWEFAQFFFEQVSALQQRKSWVPSGPPLTWSAGMIFCHVNAPIQRIKQRVHSLAEAAKKHSGIESNCLLYHVLESFDDIGRETDDKFFLDKYPFQTTTATSGLLENLLLSGEDIANLQNQMEELRIGIPRRQLYRRARALMRRGTNGAAELKTFLEDIEDTAVRQRAQTLGLGIATLLHLNQLWDYVAPREND